MTTPSDPGKPNDDWAAYEPTQIGPVDLTKGAEPTPGVYDATQIAPSGSDRGAGPAPYYSAPASEPYYSAPAAPYYSSPPVPPPAPNPVYPAAAVPYPPAPVAYPYAPMAYPQAGVAALGREPQTGQVSSIIVICVGAIFTLSCYGTLVGIAPLVLGVIGLTKANSVSRYWFAGQRELAQESADSSRTMAKWAWISFGIGLAITVIAIIVIVIWVIAAAETSSGYDYST